MMIPAIAANDKRVQHLHLEQGSQEWHEYRSKHYGASELKAALGIDPHMSRYDLMAFKKFGIKKGHSDYVQNNVLQFGHDVEVICRDIFSEHEGVMLEQAVYSYGMLSASVDGIDDLETVVLECKQANKELYEDVRAGKCPDIHYPQCQQVLLVTGCPRLIFAVTGGTVETTEYVEVKPDEKYWKFILMTWEIFHDELQDFKLREEKEVHEVVERGTLPAIILNVEGKMLSNNLDVFMVKAKEFVGEFNLTPKDDAEFAQAESDLKVLKKTREELKSAKENAMNQTGSIMDAIKIIDEADSLFQKAQSALEKAVKAQKESIRADIAEKARTSITLYARGINSDLGGIFTITPQFPDFSEAMKGKKTIKGCQDAVDLMLSECKASILTQSKHIKECFDYFHEAAKGYHTMFHFPQMISAWTTFEAFKTYLDGKLEEIKTQEAIKKAEEERRIEIAKKQAAEEAVRHERLRKEAEERQAAEKARKEKDEAEFKKLKEFRLAKEEKEKEEIERLRSFTDQLKEAAVKEEAEESKKPETEKVELAWDTADEQVNIFSAIKLFVRLSSEIGNNIDESNLIHMVEVILKAKKLHDQYNVMYISAQHADRTNDFRAEMEGAEKKQAEAINLIKALGPSFTLKILDLLY